MPQASDTALEIANNALLLCGVSKIEAFTDSLDQAIVANNFYEDVVEEALSEMRWRFSTRMVELVREGTAPVSRWDAAYTIPADSLLIHAVTIADVNIEYDIYDGAVLCNANATDDVICDHTYRSHESAWPAYFRKLVTLRLAEVFCIPLTRDETMHTKIERWANTQKVRASLYDSQQQTTRKLTMNRFLAQRNS